MKKAIAILLCLALCCVFPFSAGAETDATGLERSYAKGAKVTGSVLVYENDEGVQTEAIAYSRDKRGRLLTDDRYEYTYYSNGSVKEKTYIGTNDELRLELNVIALDHWNVWEEFLYGGAAPAVDRDHSLFLKQEYSEKNQLEAFQWFEDTTNFQIDYVISRDSAGRVESLTGERWTFFNQTQIIETISYDRQGRVNRIHWEALYNMYDVSEEGDEIVLGDHTSMLDWKYEFEIEYKDDQTVLIHEVDIDDDEWHSAEWKENLSNATYHCEDGLSLKIGEILIEDCPVLCLAAYNTKGQVVYAYLDYGYDSYVSEGEFIPYQFCSFNTEYENYGEDYLYSSRIVVFDYDRQGNIQRVDWCERVEEDSAETPDFTIDGQGWKKDQYIRYYYDANGNLLLKAYGEVKRPILQYFCYGEDPSAFAASIEYSDAVEAANSASDNGSSSAGPNASGVSSAHVADMLGWETKYHVTIPNEENWCEPCMTGTVNHGTRLINNPVPGINDYLTATAKKGTKVSVLAIQTGHHQATSSDNMLTETYCLITDGTYCGWIASKYINFAPLNNVPMGEDHIADLFGNEVYYELTIPNDESWCEPYQFGTIKRNTTILNNPIPDNNVEIRNVEKNTKVTILAIQTGRHTDSKTGRTYEDTYYLITDGTFCGWISQKNIDLT